MAVLTDNQQVALNVPDMGTSVSKNGVVILTADLIQDALDTCGGVWQAAVAYIFRMLAANQLLLSEKLGQYSYTTNRNYYVEREFYWEGIVRALGFTDAVPVIPQVIGFGICGPYRSGE